MADENYGASTGLNWFHTKDQGVINVVSPADNKPIAKVFQASEKDYDEIIEKALKILKN